MNYFENKDEKNAYYIARSHSQKIQRNLESHYGFSHSHHQCYFNVNKLVFCSKDSSDGVTHTGTTFLSNQWTLRTWRLCFDYCLKASNYAMLRIMIFECLCIWQTVFRLFLFSVYERGKVWEGSVRVGFFRIFGGTVREGSVRVERFSRRELSGRELPGGGNCPLGGTVRGGTVQVELSGRNLPVTNIYIACFMFNFFTQTFVPTLKTALTYKKLRYFKL